MMDTILNVNNEKYLVLRKSKSTSDEIVLNFKKLNELYEVIQAPDGVFYCERIKDAIYEDINEETTDEKIL